MKRYRKLFFTFWYFREPPWDTNVSPPELLDFLDHHSPGRVVDLGCGTGTNVITLAKSGWQAVGVDFVKKAIRTARRKARQANVDAEFRTGDVTNVAWVTKPFNLVLDIGCLHSLDARNRQIYIDNLDKILTPGGFFLLYTFLNTTSTSSSGLKDTDIRLISARLKLINQQEGKDGNRISSWFTFQKPAPTQGRSPVL